MYAESLRTPLKINGVVIKHPSTFKIESYSVTKSGRTADATMCMDLIAKKRKFFCTWESMTGTDLETLLRLVDSEQMFFTVEYTENGIVKTAICYAGAVQRTKVRGGSQWYWRDVEVDFIEQ